MTLAPGTRLGPYEILAPLGAGGMGEVWRARDPKLEREVAIKVLPGHLAAHPESLSRFEREAKTLAALQHPNVMGIFDFGQEGAIAYAVMELLQGETLRARLDRGPLPHRQASELAAGIALGLAAAHGKGIVHRDLKPENIFVLEDGRAKLLDFGLAKTQAPLAAQAATLGGAPTGPAGTATEAGAVLGTVGYMSPEQVRGEPADARSDIFAFGCVLYEMLLRRRPFPGETAIEVLHGVLHADPDLDAGPLSPGHRRILEHCLDKNPARRFQSAQDLAFALESSGGGATPDPTHPTRRLQPLPARRGGWRRPAAGLLLLLAGAALGAVWARLTSKPTVPAFQRITFRRGNLLHARFTPDGQNVVYSAAWDGRPGEIFLSRADGTAPRPLGIPGATIQSVNAAGELLVLLKPPALTATTAGAGTLAQASLDGGAPRTLLERVWGADYAPDGRTFAVARQPLPGGPYRLEFPPGRTLAESVGLPFTAIKVSPDGRHVAAILNDPGAAAILLADAQGRVRRLAENLRNGDTELAWAPDGRALYFMDGEVLSAVDLQGRTRRVHSDSTLSAVHHVSATGRMLVEREVVRRITLLRRDGHEANLGWQDYTRLVDLSRDGGLALLDEGGGRLGQVGQPLLRRADGSPPTLLEPGLPLALSPDGRAALLRLPGKPARLRLAPTGGGPSRDLPTGGWDVLEAVFTPDGGRICAMARQGGGPVRILELEVQGGRLRVVDTPLARFEEITPDGKDLLALDGEGRLRLAPLAGGPDRPAPGALEDGDFLMGWAASGELRIAHAEDAARLRVDLLDLRSGRRRPWTTLAAPDPGGAVRIRAARATPDGRTVAFTTGMVDVSDLLVAEGLK